MPINFGGIDISGITTDGQQVVEVTMDGDVVWQLSKSGTLIWTFKGHWDNVNRVATDSFGSIYSISDDNTVRKISEDGDQIWSFTGHTSAVTELAINTQDDIYTKQPGIIKQLSTNGSETWSYDASYNKLDIAPRPPSGYGVAATHSNGYRLLSSNGGVSQTISFIGFTPYTIAVDMNGLVYLGGSDLRKYDNSTQVWSVSHVDNIQKIRIKDYQIYTSSYRRIRRFNLEGQEDLEIFTNDASTVNDVAIDTEGYIYAGVGLALIKYNANGDKIWRYYVGSEVSGVTEYGEYVVIACSDNTVRKIKK